MPADFIPPRVCILICEIILTLPRLHAGRKPRLSLQSRDNSVREPNAQPAPATGLFTGFGVRPQRAKMDFQRSRWKSILSICGNKCTARQVAQKTFSPAFFNLCSSGNCRFRASVLQKFIACICYSKNLPFCIYLGNKSRLEQIIQSSYPFGTLLLTDFSIHHGRTSLN